MTVRMLLVLACAAALAACGGSVSVGSQDGGANGGHGGSSGGPSNSGGGAAGSTPPSSGGGSAMPVPSGGPVPSGSAGTGGNGGPVPSGGPGGSVCYGDETGCQCEASFQGHDEVIVCAAISGHCTCLLDGNVTQSFVAGVFGDGGTVCTDLSGIETLFTTGCGFKR
jgi:hypothetical protein